MMKRDGVAYRFIELPGFNAYQLEPGYDLDVDVGELAVNQSDTYNGACRISDSLMDAM